MYPRGVLTPSRWVWLVVTTLAGEFIGVGIITNGYLGVGILLAALFLTLLGVRIYADRKLRASGKAERIVVPPGPVADAGRKRFRRYAVIATRVSLGLGAASGIVGVILRGESHITACVLGGMFVFMAVSTWVVYLRTVRQLFLPSPKP